MGYNSSMIILNDALHEIENDTEFGKKVAQAVRMAPYQKDSRGQDISSGCHCNAATVIETHHADEVTLLAFGGNYAQNLGHVGNWKSTPEEMLKSLAAKLGYRVVKTKKEK